MKRALVLLGAIALASPAAAERFGAPVVVSRAIAEKDLPRALAELRPLLARCLAAYPKDDSCLILAELAGSLAVQANAPDTAPLLTSALALADRTVRPEGEDHELLIGLLYAIHIRDGRPQQALPLVERYARLEAALHGPHGNEAVEARMLEGTLLQALNRTSEGAERAARLVAELRAELRADPKASAVLLIYALRQQGDLLLSSYETVRAAEAYRECYALLEGRGLGASAEATAVLARIGDAVLVLGRNDEALAIFTRVAAQAAPDSPLAYPAKRRLGEIAHARGDYAGAIRLLEEALRFAEAQGGPKSANAADARFWLAWTYIQQGRFAAAAPWVSLIEADPPLAGVNPADIAKREFMFGIVYQIQNDYIKARPHFEKVKAALSAAGDERSPFLFIAEAALGQAALAGGDPAQARQLLTLSTTRKLRSIAERPDFDPATQRDLALAGPVFRVLVEANWRLAQQAGGRR